VSLSRHARRFVGVWVDLFRRHDLLTAASAIAFQSLVAAVALALLALGILGKTGNESLWWGHVAPQIQSRVLPEVYAGIAQTVQHVFAADSTGLVVFAVLISIWEVSGSVRGCMGALNRVYETDEKRPWWRRFPVSFAISAAVILALLGAVLLVMAAGGAVHGDGYVPFAVVRWLTAILLLVLAFGLLVRFAPAEPRAKRWASVGSALVVVAWIVEAFVFKWYVEYLANFRTAPGSLFVVLVVTAFFYVGSIILLVGIELDELLRENAKAAERTFYELLRATAQRS
jgi:membrane protein